MINGVRVRCFAVIGRRFQRFAIQKIRLVRYGLNHSNRCVFVVSSLAGIVLKLPRVSYPAKASAATRDAKCLGAGRERPQDLARPLSSRRMWSVFGWILMEV
jgi:hypothetical protein